MNVKDARLVVISVTTRETPPECIKFKPDETPAVTISGKKVADWKLCYLRMFPISLPGVGYSLVDAYYKRRFTAKGVPYYIVHFVFSKNEFAEVSEYFSHILIPVWVYLGILVRDFCGSVVLWNNPFFKDQEVFEGTRVFSLTCNNLGVDPRTKAQVSLHIDDAGEIFS